MNKRVINIFRTIINTISLLILIYLFVISIFSTTGLDIMEKLFFLEDNYVLNMLFLLLIIILSTLIYQNFKKIKIPLYIPLIILILLIIILVSFIYFAKLVPTADQYFVINIANRFHEGDFSSIDKGNYLQSYNNQAGIILFFYYLSFLFKKNYQAYQMLNIVFLILFFIFMYKIIKLIYKRYHNNEDRTNLTLLAILLFIPIFLYTTFIYGNIIGLALSIIALYLELKYLEDKKKIKMFLSILFICTACIIKMNNLITLITMAIILIVESISKKKLTNILVVFLMILAYLISNKIILKNIEFISGKRLEPGIPIEAWIAMGLQDTESGPGWYNGYNKDIYINNDNNREKAKEHSIQNIKESINKFLQNPKYCYDFFTRKIVSQWNDPTFESEWIILRMSFEQGKQSVIEGVNDEKIYNIFANFMNLYQSFLLMGACFYFIFNFKKNDFIELVFAIIFIGGFIFHIFWEAKGQYTILYFILLIPYSINGFIDFVKNIIKLNKYIKL